MSILQYIRIINYIISKSINNVLLISSKFPVIKVEKFNIMSENVPNGFTELYLMKKSSCFMLFYRFKLVVHVVRIFCIRQFS